MYKKGLLLMLVAITHILYAASTDIKNLMQTFSLDEKIGQLFIAGIYLQKDGTLKTVGNTSIEDLIKKYHIGGLLFLGKQSTPEIQHACTNYYQSISKVPLLISQDLEWGLSMRLKKAIRFPRNMTLGAIQDNNLIYQLGMEIGRQCKAIGVHLNLAPVVDINSNPHNPIINDRSFGENQLLVAEKSIAFMLGLQDSGIIACAKHFPGHGDTHIDSHLDLPCITHPLALLKKRELFPFKKIIDAGIMSVMIGHLDVPAIEKKQHLPATLSSCVITKQLKEKLGFQGLVITDALDMQGILKYHTPGELERDALHAGNDLLLCATDIPIAITTIKNAIHKGELFQKELDKKVKNILLTKEWALRQEDKNITHNIHSRYAYTLKQILYEKAITLVQNKNNTLPTNDPDIIVIPIHAPISENIIQQIETITNTDKKVVLVLYCNPYNLRYFEHLDVDAIIVAYEDDIDAKRAAEKVISGELYPSGTLPVSASHTFYAGLGLQY